MKMMGIALMREVFENRNLKNKKFTYLDENTNLKKKGFYFA